MPPVPELQALLAQMPPTPAQRPPLEQMRATVIATFGQLPKRPTRSPEPANW